MCRRLRRRRQVTFDEFKDQTKFFAAYGAPPVLYKIVRRCCNVGHA